MILIILIKKTFAILTSILGCDNKSSIILIFLCSIERNKGV